MRRRFFVEQFENDRAVMRGEAAHHVGRVLRAQPGQLYELSDGTSVWLGRIETVDRDEVNFQLLEQLEAFHSTLKATLLLSIVKFDAFEWALEKATELGITQVVPVAAARSEKGLLAAVAKRSERWRKILMESSQQSRRVQIPTLESLVTPQAAFQHHTEGLRLMLSESQEAPSLRRVLPDRHVNKFVLAIGPEGGWTEEELAVARNAGFLEASLGKLILRTETAVIASLAAINFALSGD